MSNREDTINSAVPNLDAVFTEGREADISPRVKIRNWLFCPLLLVAVVGYRTFLQVVGKFLGSDIDVAERLADDHNVPLHKVDKPFHNIISEERNLLGLANWILIVFPVILYLESSPARSLAKWLLIAIGIALMAVFVAGTMQVRNYHILTKMNRISQENSVESACLITGGEHEDDLQELAELFDIKVIDDNGD